MLHRPSSGAVCRGGQRCVPVVAGRKLRVTNSHENGKQKANAASTLNSSSNDVAKPHSEPHNNKGVAMNSGDSLTLATESDRKGGRGLNLVKTTGLRRAPLSGGVKTATTTFDLPSPAVAVRNLVEQAQFAHLCTVMSGMHHRRSGFPFGTLVDFAADGAGFPIFCLSPLAIHARNLLEDPRCSMVVQMPGWTGLANARVTIFGEVYQLPQDMQETAREVFLAKQAPEKKEKWVFGNFLFFRMHKILDIYFVGGFGTVQWIDIAEYLSSKPDQIATNHPQKTLQLLTETYADDLLKMLAKSGIAADEIAFISIDASGTDVRIRSGQDYNVERLGFDFKVHTEQDAMEAVKLLVERSQ